MATPPGLAETHISTVFFTAERAYKILKPLDVGFADFSQLAERLDAVDREVELNRRLAPDVYLGTADVHENGELVDRMIVMRRLAEDHCLQGLLDDDRRAFAAGEGSSPQDLAASAQACLDAVVRVVARLHMDGGAVHGEAAQVASRDSVRRNWEDNFEAIESHVGSVIERDEFAEVRDLARAYLDGCTELFEARIRAGWVRDGHGDLRAEDIFCEADGPRILDCLAFSDDLRVSDVLADIGFLAMDVINSGHPTAAQRLLELYCELTAETHPRSLARHYIAYRAHVRTKICCLQHAQGEPDKVALARDLHRLALDQLRRAVPMLVIVGGAPGTGKSTVARALSDSEGLAYIGSDELRKELAGLASSDRASAAVNEGIYTPEMTQRLYDEMHRRAEVLLSVGEPVVLDASFTADSHREMARELASRRQARIVELRCEVDPRIARNRVEARTDDPSDAHAAVVDHLAARAEPWPGATVIDTTGEVSAVLADATSALGAARGVRSVDR